jgi:hypothetical protein
MTKCNHFNGCNNNAVNRYDSLLLCEEHSKIVEIHLKQLNEIFKKVNAKRITSLGLGGETI